MRLNPSEIGLRTALLDCPDIFQCQGSGKGASSMCIRCPNDKFPKPRPKRNGQSGSLPKARIPRGRLNDFFWLSSPGDPACDRHLMTSNSNQEVKLLFGANAGSKHISIYACSELAVFLRVRNLPAAAG